MADEILPGDCLPHGERRRYVAPHRFYIPEPGCTCERAMTSTVADDLDPAAIERLDLGAIRVTLAANAGRDGGGWDGITYALVAEVERLRAALAAAGPLVTPEHDAQVAARAWDEGFTRGFYAAQVMPLDADASESTIPNPYEQEGDR